MSAECDSIPISLLKTVQSRIAKCSPIFVKPRSYKIDSWNLLSSLIHQTIKSTRTTRSGIKFSTCNETINKSKKKLKQSKEINKTISISCSLKNRGAFITHKQKKSDITEIFTKDGIENVGYEHSIQSKQYLCKYTHQSSNGVKRHLKIPIKTDSITRGSLILAGIQSNAKHKMHISNDLPSIRHKHISNKFLNTKAESMHRLTKPVKLPQCANYFFETTNLTPWHGNDGDQ